MRTSSHKTSYRKILLTLPAAPSLASSFETTDDEDSPLCGRQITTVVYALIPVGGGRVVSGQYCLIRKNGRAVPTTSTLELAATTAYTGSLALFDETAAIPANISAVLCTHSEAYLVCYEPTPARLVAITRTDKDKNKAG